MDAFKLDLSKDATRTSFVRQLRASLGEVNWQTIELVARRAGIQNDRHYHSAGDVFKLVDGLDIDSATQEHMRAVYTILAEAEAQVHGSSVNEVHFHEVGRASGILNTLVICRAFVVLDAWVIRSTPVQTGEGTVECAHGTMSIPTPATRAILGHDIPLCSYRLQGELCTPTSAALIRHFVTEFVSG